MSFTKETLVSVQPPHITTKIRRPDPEALARLGAFSSATIHEAQGRRGAVAAHIKPVDPSMRFFGSAFTVVCAPRDNLMLQVAIHYAQPGDVILVSAAGMRQAGTFGDVLGNAAKAKGVAAVVTDSGVRDTADLKELGLPVFSGSVSITGTVKETLGPINQPLIFGGELVNPGDAVIGDADGVVVVPQDRIEEVAAASQAREEHEAALIQKYKAGGTTIDLCNLHDVLRYKGLTTDLDAQDPNQGLGVGS